MNNYSKYSDLYDLSIDFYNGFTKNIKAWIKYSRDNFLPEQRIEYKNAHLSISVGNNKYACCNNYLSILIDNDIHSIETLGSSKIFNVVGRTHLSGFVNLKASYLSSHFLYDLNYALSNYSIAKHSYITIGIKGDNVLIIPNELSIEYNIVTLSFTVIMDY